MNCACFLEQSSIYLSLITICLKENKNKYVDHNDLSIALNISKTNLSNIIKRIDKYGLINYEKIGRNKYYYLSQKGNDFYQYLLEENSIGYYRHAKEVLNTKKSCLTNPFKD